jgi:hypothetical protein
MLRTEAGGYTDGNSIGNMTMLKINLKKNTINIKDDFRIYARRQCICSKY